jgi:preprotein translocase subunit SecE
MTKKTKKDLSPAILKIARKRLARSGGKAVLKKYGKDHFKELSKLSWVSRKKKKVVKK